MSLNSKDLEKSLGFPITSKWDTLHLLTMIHLQLFQYPNFSQSVALLVLHQKIALTYVHPVDGMLLSNCMKSFHLLN